MVIPVFLSIDLRWRDSEVLKAGYWLVGQELLTTDSVKRCLDPTRQTHNSQVRSMCGRAIIISWALTFLGIFDLPVQLHLLVRREVSAEKFAHQAVAVERS